MSEQQLQPQADRAWAIEMYGIEPIADQDRHGKSFELFWVWFAANIGILGIAYGGILTAAGLNLWQTIPVSRVAPLVSFALAGVLRIAGKWGRAPMLPLPRAPFGTPGNPAPALLTLTRLY